MPLPGRSERRPHDRRRRRDVQDPPDPERRPAREDMRHRRRVRRRSRRSSSAEVDELEARGVATERRASLGRGAPDHAVARRDRPGERAPPRQAADRHDPARASGRATRTRRRGSGSASRTCSSRRSSARRSRSRWPRRTSGSSASTAFRRSSSRRSRSSFEAFAQRIRPYVARHVAARRPRAARGHAGAPRRRAGHAARPRPRHVSVRHLVEHRRGERGDRYRHRPEPHRPRSSASRRRT